MVKKWATCQKKNSKQKQKNCSDKLKTAFSVLELCIVLALFFSLVTLSIPKQLFESKSLLQDETERLFLICSFLHQKALTSNVTQKLTCNIEQNNYTYMIKNEAVTYSLPPHIFFGAIPSTKGPPSSPITEIKKAITFHNNQIIFHPNGKISPGTIYLTETKQKSMKALTCPISQVSFIRKYYYKNNKWILDTRAP